MKTNLLFKLNTVISAFCLVAMTVFSVTGTSIAEAAGPAYNVLGYAWSYHPSEQSGDYFQNTTVASASGLNPLGTQGFGWISMSGANPDSGGGSYKVTLDPTTGKFGGYAWSENGGYVNFAPAGPYPSAAGTAAASAYVDPTCIADKTRTCPVKGWIRFVAGTSGSSNWDGWVNMEIFNDSTAASVYQFPLSAPASGVKLLPEANGYRAMSGYAWGDWLAGIIGFSKAKVELTDVCPDTKFAQTSNPKNTGIDPLTAGTQTTIPKGYSVKDGMCGIFGCTDKSAVNFVKTATIDDGSCVNSVLCPDGTPAPNDDVNQCPQPPTCTPKSETYNPVFKDCRECHPGVTGYNESTGLCTTDPNDPGGNGDPVDQCVNIKDVQTTVPSPYTQVIQSGVKNCYIVGCTDPHANNPTPGATMQDNPSTCQYDQNVEICGNKKDDDGDGQTDEGCPSYPTAPKKPIYIET